MFELCDAQPRIDVQPAEFNRLLGYPRNHVLEGRARELAGEVRQWYQTHARPWLYARELAGLDLRRGRVRVAGVEFASAQLHEQLAAAGARRVVLVAVSAGPECELRSQAHWREGRPDEYLLHRDIRLGGSGIPGRPGSRAALRLGGPGTPGALAALQPGIFRMERLRPG